ncbi:ABC-type transport system, substrate-binding protein [Candidatus Phytoplasma solani]|uniref:ABC transporter substrate-binding protein n=1 Tax=Candidatus Phytoplasma solani TaxID=69896 RepID=UPI0032DBDFC6
MKKINFKKKFIIIFIFIFITLSIFLLWGLKIKDRKQKTKNNNFDKIFFLSHIPQSSKVLCLEKNDFPIDLNIYQRINTFDEQIQEIFNYLKQDIFEETFQTNSKTNEIILKIKPNLTFENDESINAQTLKNSLKIYIDNNLAKDLIELLNQDLVKYIIEYRKSEKDKLFNDFISIDKNDDLKIKIKLKENTPSKQIIEYLKKKIFLIPSKYESNNLDNDFFKKKYGFPKYPLLSYGEYKINKFDPFNMILELKLITENKNNSKINHIIYLNASKGEQRELFRNGKISCYIPLEDIDSDIFYNDHIQNQEFLENENYNKKFTLDERQLFLIFNLTTKKNRLKSKILEQLVYFKDYFNKNEKNNDNKENIINKLENNYKIISEKEQENEICNQYKDLLKQLWEVKDKTTYQKYLKILDNWENAEISHPILQDKDFRKSLYFLFDRQEIIKNIFPFFTPSCYLISELSEFSYDKNVSLQKNLNNFLDLEEENQRTEKNNLLSKSFDEEKAKNLFFKAYDKLPLDTKTKPIELKISCFDDKRFEMLFDYLQERFKTFFENKIILKRFLTMKNSSNDKETILEKNNQGENLSSTINSLLYPDNVDLFIDSQFTSNFNFIMFFFLTNFYCNYIFDIDLNEELSQIPEQDKEKLKNKIHYTNKEFIGIDQNNRLKGNVDTLNAFIINISKNNFNNKERIILKLLNELEKIF